MSCFSRADLNYLLDGAFHISLPYHNKKYPKPGRELINEVPMMRVLDDGVPSPPEYWSPPDVNTLIKRVPNPYLANYTPSVFVMRG